MIGACWLKPREKVDVLVFASGVNEKGKEPREIVVEQCTCLGFAINKRIPRGADARVHLPSPVKAFKLVRL
jgi:acetate kinase